MQILRSAKTDIHFESEEFMNPDLTKAEIQAFLLTKIKWKLYLRSLLVTQHLVANSHDTWILMQKISNLPLRQLGHCDRG